MTNYLDMLREQARRSLDAWANFPADAQPRPLVLLSPMAISAGFPSVETKVAFMRGAIEAAPGFPVEVLKVMRQGWQPGCYSGTPLLVISAAWGSAGFLTDRGREQLPAWKVQARDVPEPIWVLDPVTRQRAWQPQSSMPEWHGTTAILRPDGRTLVMTLEHRHAEVLESKAAVVIVPIHGPDLRDAAPESQDVARFRTSFGPPSEVAAVLAQPLGHRVLLEVNGSPVLVRT